MTEDFADSDRNLISQYKPTKTGIYLYNSYSVLVIRASSLRHLPVGRDNWEPNNGERNEAVILVNEPKKTLKMLDGHLADVSNGVLLEFCGCSIKGEGISNCQ